MFGKGAFYGYSLLSILNRLGNIIGLDSALCGRTEGWGLLHIDNLNMNLASACAGCFVIEVDYRSRFSSEFS